MDKLIFLIPLAIFLILLPRYLKQRRRRLPPGPKDLPLIGALLEHPTQYQYRTYIQWGREYDSDIIYCTILGQPILVLNSAEAANDLLEGRSSIYSDRQQRPMIDLVGWNKNAVMLGYDDLWRQHRRLFQQYFNPAAIQQHHACMSRESKLMLQQILETPGKFMKHIQRMAGSVIVEVTYGIKVKLEEDPHVIAAEKAMESFAAVGNAGSYMIEYIPWLRYLPVWFPGAGFKRDAEKWRRDVSHMYDTPFNMVKGGKVDSQMSITASMLSKLDEKQDNTDIERIIRDVTGSAYAGGSDTSVSQLWTFVLAMLLYPDVQAKAQADIDRVVGRDRLPELEDRDSLPYITAIMRESFRWRPVAPLAAPHRLLVDDEYRGYHIPAGTLVVGNAWAIMHDPAHFAHPESFDPTHHLDADGALFATDTSINVFGFGRRLCPGRHFGQDTVWLAIAQMLAVFEIRKAVGEDGKVLEPSGEYTPGILVHPKPFPASFKPRSEGARGLIQSSLLYES